MTSQSSKRPLIAIVGSIDPNRADDLELSNTDQAASACAALGHELAVQGVDIVVYSSAADFVEGDVVRGYAASDGLPARSIQVHAPQSYKYTQFPEAGRRPELFEYHPDASEDWEVSFYRSLVDTDGVLLLGGGRSTFVTGLIALAFGIPILAIASFGGRAVRVWQALDRVRNDAEPKEIELMGSRSWRDDQAGELVQSLVKQGERRAAKRAAELRDARKDARHSYISLFVAAVCVILAFGAIPLSYSYTPGTGSSIALLIVAPLLAATAGAIVRHSFEQGHEWFRTAVLGMAAGGVSALLFIAAQLLTEPGVLSSPDARRLLWFVVPVGFVSGLTFDAVYRKLRAQDVTRSDVLNEL
jgi:hypothetical protein